MKLQERMNRKVGDKEYKKMYLDIPADKIEEAGWSVGDEIEAVVKRHEILLKLNKKKSQN